MTHPPPPLRTPAPGSIAYLRVKVGQPYKPGLIDVQIVDKTGRPTDAVTHVVEAHQLLSKERVLQ